MNCDEIDFEESDLQIVLLETFDSRSTELEARLGFDRAGFGIRIEKESKRVENFLTPYQMNASQPTMNSQ